MLSLCKVVIVLENKQMLQALGAFLVNATIYADALMQRGATTPATLKVLDSVKSDKWRSLLKFDTEGVKSAMEKEREVRDNLKKMNWW